MAIVLRFVLLLMKLIGYLLTPVTILVNLCRIRQQKIPPIRNELLLNLPVIELAAKIRNKEVCIYSKLC